MECTQPENSEVSGTDPVKNRGSVPRISACQGHSVLILVQMMDIIMLAQVVGSYTDLYNRLCTIRNNSELQLNHLFI